MWDALVLMFEQKSASNKLLLVQRFHAYQMCSTDTVVQHITKVQNLARQLLDIGENVSDTTIMAKILTGLSEKFSFFHTAWDSVEPTRQTLVYLRERLIQEENRLDANGGEATALAAMAKRMHIDGYTAGGKNDAKYRGEKRDLRDIRCYRCQEKGHFARKCPNGRRDQENDESDSSRNWALIVDAKGAQALAEQVNKLMRSSGDDA